MKTMTTILMLCLFGCLEGYPGSDDTEEDAVDPQDSQDDGGAWVLCSTNSDPVCDDGDPCTFDICNEAFPCDNETCEGDDPGPTICWHLPLDADNDGYATATDRCGFRGTPFEDCDDSDSQVNPGMFEICGDGIDNNCDGLTDLGLEWYNCPACDFPLCGEKCADRGFLLSECGGIGVDAVCRCIAETACSDMTCRLMCRTHDAFGGECSAGFCSCTLR